MLATVKNVRLLRILVLIQHVPSCTTDVQRLHKLVQPESESASLACDRRALVEYRRDGGCHWRLLYKGQRDLTCYTIREMMTVLDYENHIEHGNVISYAEGQLSAIVTVKQVGNPDNDGNVTGAFGVTDRGAKCVERRPFRVIK